MENNKFIQDCLAKLANNAEARERFNKQQDLVEFDSDGVFLQNFPEEPEPFEKLNKDYKIIIIQTFLSTTPDGQAVMPFLDVETHESKKILAQMEKIGVQTVTYNPFYGTKPNVSQILKQRGSVDFFRLLDSKRQTLRQLLLQEFTRVCFGEGQGFGKALETINSIYLQNV